MDSFWILVLSITVYFIVIGFIINQNQKVGGFIFILNVLIFLGYVIYLLGFVYLRPTLIIITLLIVIILSVGIPIVVGIFIFEYGIKRFESVLGRLIDGIKSKIIKDIIKVSLGILLLVVIGYMFTKGEIYLDFVFKLTDPIMNYINDSFS